MLCMPNLKKYGEAKKASEVFFFFFFFLFENTNLQKQKGQYKTQYLTVENPTCEVLHGNLK